MNPQVQPKVAAPSQEQAQPPRIRPAVPEGARPTTTAAAKTPAPMPAPTPQSPAPVASTGMARTPDASPPAPTWPRAQERRRSPRQTLVAKAVVRSEFNQNTVATGFLSNISMLGVGFHTRRPLNIGEKFQMRLELGPMKWATRLRVVSCQAHDSGTYDVGAEFIGNDLTERVGRELAA